MKKTVCIILSLLLAVTVLSSCSKKEKEAPEPSDYALKFSFDSAYSGFDESVVSAYEALCTAVVNYEESVRMNPGITGDVMQLYETSFPLHVLATGVENAEGIVLTYQYEKEEHLQRVKAFSDTVKEIVTQCYAGTLNKTVYTLNAYSYVCEHYSEADNSSVYDAVMNSTGNQYAYSGMFEYLLQQADIPAYHVIGISDFGGDVALSQAELDGEIYYFDVAFEAATSKGKLLRYFGMTIDDVTAQGVSKMSYTNRNDPKSATDLRFDTCRRSTGWEIADGKLLVSVDAETAVEIAL